VHLVFSCDILRICLKWVETPVGDLAKHGGGSKHGGGRAPAEQGWGRGRTNKRPGDDLRPWAPSARQEKISERRHFPVIFKTTGQSRAQLVRRLGQFKSRTHKDLRSPRRGKRRVRVLSQDRRTNRAHVELRGWGPLSKMRRPADPIVEWRRRFVSAVVAHAPDRLEQKRNSKEASGADPPRSCPTSR
jgi:hypothetical protein